MENKRPNGHSKDILKSEHMEEDIDSPLKKIITIFRTKGPTFPFYDGWRGKTQSQSPQNTG